MAVTGDPTLALVDALRTALTGDATLMALVTAVVGKLSEASRTVVPYLVLGRRHHSGDSGAMQKEGGHVSVDIDGWASTPAAMHAIHSRVYVLLERTNLTVTGFTLVQGSMHREFAEVFDEPDADAPDRRLYHGVQQWIAEIHES